MKILKKLGRFFLLLLIILVVAAFVLPYIYEEEIKEKLKEYVNENVDAKVDFSDISLSLFRSFPKFAIDIEDLDIKGIDQFENFPLFEASTLRLNADLSTIIKKDVPINVSSIELEDANINILIAKDGSANYNIIPESGSAEGSTSAEYALNLDSYSIKNSSLAYKDLANDIEVNFDNFNHTGSGNFENEKFEIASKTSLNNLNLYFGGITYLAHSKLDASNIIQVDNTSGTYLLDKNSFRLNALDVFVDGKVINKNNLDFDLKLDTKESSFAQFLSIVPNSFKGDFNAIDSKGKAKIAAKLKGLYNSTTGTLPSYNIDINVNDGYAKFPGFPKAIERLELQGTLASTNANTHLVDIKALDLLVGQSVLNGNFQINQKTSGALISGKGIANIDLDDVLEAFPVEGMESMNGKIVLDELLLDANLEDIQNQNYSNIEFSGDLKVSDIIIKAQDKPQITINTFEAKANPKALNLQQINVALGKSDVLVNGNITNPLAYFFPNEALQGNIELRSKFLDLNEWMPKNDVAANQTSIIDTSYANFAKSSRIKYSANVDQINYGNYQIKNNTSSGVLGGDEVIIDAYNGELYNNKFSLTGSLTNLFDYIFSEESITGELEMRSNNFDVNPFLTSETDTKAVPEIYRVPKNMDIKIATHLKNVKYQKMLFNEMNGSINMNKGAIEFKEVVSKALGGDMDFEGLYDSNFDEPKLSLKYDLSRLKFKETFKSLPFLENLAGVMEFIDGVFNSTLVMETNLNQNMFPNLSTLNAQGYLETLKGKISKLKPIEELGNKLGVDELKNFDISGTKNWFEIKNGTVGLKPEEYTYNGMKFILSGSHGYNSDISYTILAQIPRSKFKQNALTNTADKGLQFLESQAKKVGMDLKQGDTLNLRIDLGGSLLNPSLNIVPLGSSGKSLKEEVKDKLVDEFNNAKDTLQQKAEEKVEQVKDTLTQVVEEKIDTLTNKVEEKVNQQIDTLQNKIEEKVTEKIDTMVADVLGESLDTLVNNKVDSLLQGTIKDVLGDKKEKEVDKIKDKLKDWNPFKKKGGGN